MYQPLNSIAPQPKSPLGPGEKLGNPRSFNDLAGEVQSRHKSGSEHSWSMVCLITQPQIEAMKCLLIASSFILAVAATAQTRSAPPRAEAISAELLISGRNAEAEIMAERAVRDAETDFGPGSLALFEALHLFASARLEQGKTRMAWKAFERMQAIPARLPEERAMLHETAAVLLQIEGKTAEALAESLKGIAALTEAGRENTSDAASLLNMVAALYIGQHRFSEALAALDQALEIFTTSPDSVAFDRIKLLHVRAAVHARTGERNKALEDLREAVSLSDQNAASDPEFRERLLEDYAKLLHKNHRGREARKLETQAALLHGSSYNNAVIDVTELGSRSK